MDWGGMFRILSGESGHTIVAALCVVVLWRQWLIEKAQRRILRGQKMLAEISLELWQSTGAGEQALAKYRKILTNGDEK
jgi:hypothetical protein